MKKNTLFLKTIFGIKIALLIAFKLPAQTPGFTVANDNSGDYKTVQEAIDATPSNSNTRTEIFIKNGTYYEVITIPSSKKNLSFIGESVEGVILTYDNAASKTNPATGSNYGTSNSSSIFINGAGFYALNITFENNADPSYGQAVAVRCTADKSVFKNCRFLGNQDTYYAHSGRAYHEDCYIEGTTDFIFGGAIAFFENCQIYSKGGTSLTAASTAENVAFGYVFNNCTVSGKGPNITDFGRPWRPYASVTFLNSNISNTIKPAGWNNWGNSANESTARFGEFNNSGEGADLSGRVDWMIKLNPGEALQYNMLNVLKATNANPQVNDNWNPFVTMGKQTSDISVSVSSPLNGDGFDENSSINLEANATVNDSEISNVKFYSDTLLHQDNEAPYSFTLNAVKAGIYHITATATDTSGFTGFSQRITIFVGSGFSIINPIDGTKFNMPDKIQIEANAWVSNGTIVDVEFFQGTTSLGKDSSRPYVYTWENVPPGIYQLTAKATDSNNNTHTSNEVNVEMVGGPEGFEFCSADNETCTFDGVSNVAYGSDGKFNYKYNVTGSVDCSSTFFGDPNYGQPKACYVQPVTFPVVKITSPAWSASFDAPAEITINADAIDYDGTVDSVQFFQNDILIGVSIEEPFSYLWENVSGGRYTLTAVATDNDGKTSVSNKVNINVKDVTGINELNDVIAIYPNPVNDELTLKLNKNFLGNTNIILYNNDGKVIINEQMLSQKHTVDLKNIPEGIYLISLIHENKEVYSRKVIKN